MKIFGHPMSTCTRKVRMALAEKQANYDFVLVDIMQGAHKAPEYVAARQPFGQIPALEDGDFKMYESRAMMRYIDETMPGQALTPKDAKGRATVEQWISIESSDFTPHAMTIIYQCMFAPMRGGTTDMAKVEEAKAKLPPVLEVMDKALAKGPHLLGDSFTLADIAFMPYMEYAMLTPAKDMIMSYPHVAAWWKRISERPTWKQATAAS
jgi:glutathione S-transferase